MLYVHSFSPVEVTLSDRLSIQENLVEINIHQIKNRQSFDGLIETGNEKILLYSFQQLEYYRHLETFQNECKAADTLIDYITEQGYTRIILITYPGAYFNSTNLYLQHKGLLEQKFVNSGIPCTLLNVQAIHDPVLQISNLHALFYDATEQKYMIPQKSNCIVYSINLKSLCEIILNSLHNDFTGKFDVFDTIYELKTFLPSTSPVQRVQRISPLYLYFKSYLGIYASPTMLELFLMTIVPMYKFRTEKEFGISLDQDHSGIRYSFNRLPLNLTGQYNTLLNSLIPVE